VILDYINVCNSLRYFIESLKLHYKSTFGTTQKFMISFKTLNFLKPTLMFYGAFVTIG
jgi:hypothetical protein